MYEKGLGSADLKRPENMKERRTMKQLGPQYATANFYFPNEHGADVIMELVTKENPMTPERMRKIQAFRISGYRVLVWYEEDLDTFEKYDRKMQELQKLLGRYDEKEMRKYEHVRRKTYHDLFG